MYYRLPVAAPYIQVDIQARTPFLEVFKLDVDSCERYLDFEPGVLHKIPGRIYLAEWFGPGGPCGKRLSNVEKLRFFGFC